MDQAADSRDPIDFRRDPQFGLARCKRPRPPFA